MAEEKMTLPRSSMEEICRVIQAYSHFKQGAVPKQVSDIVKSHPTTVSGNNGFLSRIGVLDGGREKSLTELGRDLSLALEHNRSDEIRSTWQEVVKSTEFLSNLVSTVRLRNGMSEADFISHVLYVAKASKSSNTATGARTVLGSV